MKSHSRVLIVATFGLCLAVPDAAFGYYHAQLGRFVARDLIGYSDGMNLYDYAGGNPTLRQDPMGNKFSGCDPPGRQRPWSGWTNLPSSVGKGTCTYYREKCAPRTCYWCWIPYSSPICIRETYICNKNKKNINCVFYYGNKIDITDKKKYLDQCP
jgi:hypothetical protein